MNKYIVFVFLFALVNLNGMSSPVENIDTTHIQGIKIAYRTSSIDVTTCRRNLYETMYEKGDIALLKTATDIKEFLSLLKPMEYIRSENSNVYSDFSVFIDYKRLGVYKHTRNTFSADGFAVIYFTNGKLPLLLWLDSGQVLINNSVYGYKEALKGVEFEKTLANFVEKEKAPNVDIRKLIRLWADNPIDCSDITHITFYMWPRKYTSCATRTQIIEQTAHKAVSIQRRYPQTQINIYEANREDIELFMNLISKCSVERTLYYNTDDCAELCEINDEGNLIWHYVADPVIGMVTVQRKQDNQAEIIWISKNGFDRGFFNFSQTKQLSDFICQLR